MDISEPSALAGLTFSPLAEVVAKVRREERYHLMHLDVWLRRLADHPGAPRERLEKAWQKLAPDALSVFTPLPGERLLVDAGVMSATTADQADRWRSEVGGLLGELRLERLWPTLCRPIYYCAACRQPFEKFKEV